MKAPSRVRTFKEVEPGLSLPPQPVTTRWGTWIEAVSYYAENYEKIVNIFHSFDEEDSAAVKTAKELLERGNLKTDLVFLAANYGFFSKSIKKLETNGLELAAYIDIVNDAEIKVSSIDCKIGRKIKTKMSNVLEKNRGFKTLKEISSCLSGQNSTVNEYTVSEIIAFKFAPITSVEVERSFSMYKNVFRANRQSFLFDNLSKIICIYCNKNLN